MKRRNKLIIVLISLVILCSGFFIIIYLKDRLQNQTIDVGQPLVTILDQELAPDNLQHLIYEAQKSVVQINVETNYSERSGSGFLYNSRGDIVTNAHVIENATAIQVTMSNTETYPAAIVGFSMENDIAVIRVPQLINYQPIELEISENYLSGAEIVAVGSPLGFQNTVSVGIISGVDRSFDINDYTYENVYQISANITHGNSGGPLIDRHTGKVIGINSAGIEESDIAFSIPVPAIIDQITDWSASITNDQLTFPSRVNNMPLDTNELLEEATYLIHYFVDSIGINDYINAYTLLGSTLQSEMDYPSFRSNYIHLRNISLLNYEIAESTKETVLILATIEHQVKENTDEKKQIVFSFTIGYENGQLKLLQIESIS